METIRTLCLICLLCATKTLYAQESPHCYFEYNPSINIHYEKYGDGETSLVFLHGFACSTQSWYDILPMLDRKQYSIYLVDLKGFGASSKPKDNIYTFEEQAEIICAFLKSIETEKLVLVGHSYGGGVSLLSWVKLQSDKEIKIDKMVLIDAGAYTNDVPLFIQVLRIPVINRIAMGFPKNKFTVKQILKTFFRNHDAITENLVQRYVKLLKTKGITYSYIKLAKQIIPDNHQELTEKYNGIDIPVLIIWGDKDGEITVENGKRLHAVIPNSQLEILDNCGHVPHEEHPQLTFEIMERFLNE